MFEMFLALSALVATTPPEAISVEDGRVVIRSLPHWEQAYKLDYRESLRCRRGGEAEIAYRRDSRDKESVFYEIESVSLDGVRQSDAVIERLNETLYSFDEMPHITLQCYQRQYRMAFMSLDDQRSRGVVIVPFDMTSSDEVED